MLRSEPALTADRAYLTLDDFAILAAARANPESLVSEVVTLDEVQRCPDFLLSIKREVDRRRTPGRFVLSGSANLALLGGIAETLAGRAAYFILHPMTRREVRGRTSAIPFLVEFLDSQTPPRHPAEPVDDREVLAGGLPPVCLGPAGESAEWFRGYVQTYVERDVRQISRITDLVSFNMLARLAAFRTGQVLAVSDLARDAKLNTATAGRYLHLLEASFLVQRLPPFLRNRSARLIKSPKLYMTDSGLAAHMTGTEDLTPGRDDRIRGALYETYVAQNLMSLIEAHLPDARMSYWHEQGRHEVDFVIESGRAILAIEVKASTQWRDDDLSGLRAFATRTPDCTACILAYNGREAVRLGERLWALPIGHLLA